MWSKIKDGFGILWFKIKVVFEISWFKVKDFSLLHGPKSRLEKTKPNDGVRYFIYLSNVMLDSGEFVYNEVDLSIPGRGFDFVFQRIYRSQAIYSGTLGWGWDHNYNRRLLELYSGDMEMVN